jgi:hypothetical protein
MSEILNQKCELLLAESTVCTCAYCGCWIGRFPDFMGEPFDKGYECDVCGATSIKHRKGRPFGHKSKQWPEILEYWNTYYDEIIDMIRAFDLYKIVITNPPLQKILKPGAFRAARGVAGPVDQPAEEIIRKIRDEE